MTFKDVAVDITQEDWELMRPVQKELYKTVTLQNYWNMVSLGKIHTSSPQRFDTVCSSPSFLNIRLGSWRTRLKAQSRGEKSPSGTKMVMSTTPPEKGLLGGQCAARYPAVLPATACCLTPSTLLGQVQEPSPPHRGRSRNLAPCLRMNSFCSSVQD